MCIHVMTPTHCGSLEASSIACLISAVFLRVGFQMISTGASTPCEILATTSFDCTATCSRVSGPYKSWLPVRNQICFIFKSPTVGKELMESNYFVRRFDQTSKATARSRTRPLIVIWKSVPTEFRFIPLPRTP